MFGWYWVHFLTSRSKYKLPQCQNGHAYLTSYRACYVDNVDPRKYSVAIDLKEVDHAEIYPRFLKSSPKITIFPKPSRHASLSTRGPPSALQGSPRSGVATPARQDSPSRSIIQAPAMAPSATWICPICSFSNPIPSNFDPTTANSHTNLPPCLACGIKPPLVHIVKAALTAMSNRSSALSAGEQDGAQTTIEETQFATFRCPRCTFENHPSLLSCEMCGASLVTAIDRRLELDEDISRSNSPGPSLQSSNLNEDTAESIKFSFRAGGDKIFYERLKNALIQRKWLLQSAPPIPKPMQTESRVNGTSSALPKMVGIAGLERRDQELRKNNEVIIGNAFEDLEALMTSAKEIIALAESFAAQTGGEANAVLSQSASALGLVTTKDMLNSDSLYISELSRNLAEFLTDDSKGILKKSGGIMTLVDLWSVFNRSRNGVELVSPADFLSAAEMWEKLGLPVRLRKFKSGLLVVQGRDRTEEKTIASLLVWLKELKDFDLPEEGVPWDWATFGRGVTAQETAEHFGWSFGVATEELEIAEEKGVFCRDQGPDGIRFWENWLVKMPPTASPG